MVPELCGGAPAGAVDRYGLRALVRQAAGRLAAAGVTSPQVDARILAEHLLGRALLLACLLYTSPSPRDQRGSRMPSSA